MCRVRSPEQRRGTNQRIIELDKTTEPLSLEKKQRRQAARKIARAFWFQAYKAAHPDASGDDITAAWKEAQKEQTQYGMRALKMLEKSDFVIIAGSGAVEDEADEAA
jgi:hypothetical protein